MDYNSILRQIAITVNALGGTTSPALLNSVYDTVPLTEANFTVPTASSIFPFNFLKDKMLNSQERLFLALASTATNPLRAFIESQTDPLSYGDAITTNTGGSPVVGAISANDVETGEPLTLNEIEDIQIRHRSSWMKLNVFQFALIGSRIYPTVEQAIANVCAYVRPDTDTLDLTTDILLPDVLGPPMVQGAIGECFRDDEYVEQAQIAMSLHNAWIAALTAGMARIQQQTNPTPDAQAGYLRVAAQ